MLCIILELKKENELDTSGNCAGNIEILFMLFSILIWLHFIKI